MRCLPLIGAALLVAGTASAGPELVAFPAGYRDSFVLYNKVDRPDRKTVRFMYVNPEALAAAAPGAPLPHGTVLIMEDHKAQLEGETAVLDADGRLVATEEVTNVFVMEKQSGWGAAYPAEMRNGEWEYAWFLADGTAKADAKYEGCFACHLNRSERDFTFTFWKYIVDEKG